MAGLTFDNISKHFGSIKAVDDISFEIQDGEFICLLGPSGCGKTTTLRIIAGLEQPTGGHILMGSKDVTNSTPKERDIGMVFQDYALYPHMTIAENVAYPLKVRGVSKEERHKRAAEAADSLQIGNLLDRRPAQISGGQQQRTSVARAVVHKPQVFLFDEPLSNLDAKLRLEARSFLKHLQKQLGVTAIYVTHDQAEAMALADRIAVMQSGKIVQMAPPLEVYQRPATTFVASFLGSPPMNLLPVTLELKGGDTALVGEKFRMEVPDWSTRLADFEKGSELTLGVRPEHLQLSESTGPWTISGEVYAVEPLGPEALVTLTVGERLTTVRIFSDDPPQVSGLTHLKLDPQRIHLFDSDGLRLEI